MASSASEEYDVHLYIYDLSRGLARSLSLPFLGFSIEGIWHTAIVYNSEREYFYGAGGVVFCPPKGTVLGEPTEILPLGNTQIPPEILKEHIASLHTTTFKGEHYDLFNHNCNNFSQELAQFLTGNSIPDYILNLPHEVASTPLGQIIRQFAQTDLLSRQRGGFDPNPLEIAIRERILNAGGIKMGDSDSEEGTPQPVIKKRDMMAEVEEEERKEREEKKKNREPPIVFRDLGHNVDELLDELEKSLDKVELNEEEMRCLRELREYALGEEGSWVLSDDFLNLIGRILLSGESGIGDNSRVHCLKVLAWLAVTKDDVILVLHQDRKDHVIMRYAFNIDQLAPACQEAVALLICNLFENLSTSEWLLYISEWGEGRNATSNIRVTTKVGVHALLSKEYKDIGSALVYNMLSKEVKTAVFDDVSVEVAMALLQFLTEKLSETLTWRALRSLLRCCQLARTEVPQLVKMVGPDPTALKGTSARCDEIISQLDAVLAAV